MKSIEGIDLDKEGKNKLIQMIGLKNGKGRLIKDITLLNNYLIQEEFGYQIVSVRKYIDGKQIRIWSLISIYKTNWDFFLIINPQFCLIKWCIYHISMRLMNIYKNINIVTKLTNDNIQGYNLLVKPNLIVLRYIYHYNKL